MDDSGLLVALSGQKKNSFQEKYLDQLLNSVREMRFYFRKCPNSIQKLMF